MGMKHRTRHLRPDHQAVIIDDRHEAAMLRFKLERAEDLLRRHLAAHNRLVLRATRGRRECTCARCVEARCLLGLPLARTDTATATATATEDLEETGEPVRALR